MVSARTWVTFFISFYCLSSPLSAEESRTYYPLVRAVESVVSRHPLARARAFEIRAEQSAYLVSQTALDPSLSLDANGNHNLTTIADPTQQGALKGLTTKRYGAELVFTKPLQWGTQLSLGMSESLIDTDNPFNNCVPGLPSDKCYETRLSLNLTQPLLKGRSVDANLSMIKVAQRALNLAQLKAEFEVTGLVYDTAVTYARLLLAQAQLELEQREEALAERQLKENQVRVDAGMVAQSELSALRLTFAQRTQARLEAERRRSEAEESLYRLSAERPSASLTFPTWISGGPPGASLQDQMSYDEHLEVKMIDERIAQLDAQLERLRDQALPELNAGIIVSQSGLGETFDESLKALPENRSRFYGATLSFRYPLSQRADQQIYEQLARKSALLEERKATIRRLEGEWETLKHERSALKGILKYTQEALIASRETVDAAEGRLQAGRATRFEVSQRQEAARAAELSVLQAQHTLLNHYLLVMRLKGKLLTMFGVALLPITDEMHVR